MGLRKAFAAMQCASLLREAMWSLVSELHLDVPGADYVAYTTENLERLDAALDALPGGFRAITVRRHFATAPRNHDRLGLAKEAVPIKHRRSALAPVSASLLPKPRFHFSARCLELRSKPMATRFVEGDDGRRRVRRQEVYSFPQLRSGAPRSVRAERAGRVDPPGGSFSRKQSSRWPKLALPAPSPTAARTAGRPRSRRWSISCGCAKTDRSPSTPRWRSAARRCSGQRSADAAPRRTSPSATAATPRRASPLPASPRSKESLPLDGAQRRR